MKHFKIFVKGLANRDRQGLAATEFALIAPALVALVMGSYEVVSVVRTAMKSGTAAYTIADLISRCKSVNESDVSDSFLAGELAVTSTKSLPSDFGMKVGSILFTSGGTKFDWEKSIGTGNPDDSTIISGVTGKAKTGDSLIVAVVTYSYTTVGGLPPVAVSKYAYVSPRLSGSVSFGSACDWTVR